MREVRKDEGDWVSACRNMVVPGNAGKGRPRKRWRDVVEDDLKKGRLDRRPFCLIGGRRKRVGIE